MSDDNYAGQQSPDHPLAETNRARIRKMTELVNQALGPTLLEIIDDSHLHLGHAGAASGAGHFTLVIAAPQLDGLRPLQQHRLVYSALDSMIPDEIHALQIRVSRTAPN